MATASHKTVNRAAATRPAPAVQPVRSTPAPAIQLQSNLRVSSPKDAAEVEADATARRVMRMATPEATVASADGAAGLQRKGLKEEEKLQQGLPRGKLESPYIARFSEAVGLMQRREAAPVISRKAEGQPNVASNVAANIANSRASGAPLPLSVRRFMEPRFRADFSGVRVHTGETAARLSRQLNAQAFTVGNHIFFGRERFRPETAEGQELIAHELTHTVQQGATHQDTPVRRSEDVTVTQQSQPQVQRLGISDALDYFADKANLIPGFRMFTILLGLNPINMRRVERSAANILRALIEFIPGGGLITQALENHGIFERVGTWVEQQLRSLRMTGSVIREAIDRFLDSLSWSDIFDLGGVWNRARRIFTEPIDRIIGFARGLVTGILGLIKDAILRPLARLAEGTRGYDLLKALLGEDPITGDPVPRNADTLIGGFMKLIGQEELWNNLKQAKAVARAWAWFQGAMASLLGFVRQIPGMFLQALRSLQIADLVLLPRAFAKVARVFGGFIGRFVSWAGNAVWNLLEIIFSVVAPGVMPHLRRAAGAFRGILRNPVGFVRNLVRAGVLGFRQFAARFLTHLRTSLIGWLTGAMSGANIYIPQALNMREVLKFVLSVLGLTWQNIRQKLVRAVGERAVRALETGFDLVMTLVTQGPAAAWEKIQESLGNLRDMVMEQIMTFVRSRVVQAAMTRLLTSLNPAGAFIQAIIATYNTVMFFVERLRQISQVAMSFLNSLTAIASGAIAAAANRVEQTMGGMLTLVISFLARIAGLGRVSDAVTNVINRVRQPIDRALDRVVDWIVAQARRLGRLVAGGARAAVQAVRGWLRHRASFRTVDGQQHSLYFEQRAGRPQLIRASVATEVGAYLNTLNYPSSDARAGKLAQAKTLASQIQLLTRTPAAGQPATTPQQEADIIQKVSDLSRLLTELVAGSLAQVPPVQWLRSKSATAHFSKAYYLSSATATGGSAASGTSPEYEFSVGGGWVRMHLIPYSVGGRGDPTNWVAAPGNVNSGGPVRSFETALETAVRSAAISGPGMQPRTARATQPNVVWVETEVSGFQAPMTDSQGRTLHFAEAVSFRFGLYRPDGTTWVKLDAPVSRQNVRIPPPPDSRIRLSSASGTAMRASGLPHLTGQPYSNRLVELVKQVRGAGFHSYAVLESRLLAATTRSRLFTPALITSIVNDLRSHRGVLLR